MSKNKFGIKVESWSPAVILGLCWEQGSKNVFLGRYDTVLTCLLNLSLGLFATNFDLRVN